MQITTLQQTAYPAIGIRVTEISQETLCRNFKEFFIDCIIFHGGQFQTYQVNVLRDLHKQGYSPEMAVKKLS